MVKNEKNIWILLINFKIWLIRKGIQDDNITRGIPCYIQNIHTGTIYHNSITVIH